MRTRIKFAVLVVLGVFIASSVLMVHSDRSEAASPDIVYDLGTFTGTTSSPATVVTWQGSGSGQQYVILDVCTAAYSRGDLFVDRSSAPSWWTVEVTSSKIVWRINYGAVCDGDYRIILGDSNFIFWVNAHITVTDSGSVVPDPSASEFRFTFDTDGGETMSDIVYSSVTHTSWLLDLSDVAEPVRDGYRFAGWTWNGATVTSVTCQAGQTVTLKAVWEKVSPGGSGTDGIEIPDVLRDMEEFLLQPETLVILVLLMFGAALIVRGRMRGTF